MDHPLGYRRPLASRPVRIRTVRLPPDHVDTNFVETGVVCSRPYEVVVVARLGVRHRGADHRTRVIRAKGAYALCASEVGTACGPSSMANRLRRAGGQQYHRLCDLRRFARRERLGSLVAVHLPRAVETGRRTPTSRGRWEHRRVSVREFISSIASSLAWPLVGLVALAVFGRDLRRWLKESPTKVKIGPLEAEWTRQVARAEVSLDQPETRRPADGGDRGEAVLAETLKPTVGVDPTVAVTEAASAVEGALRMKLAQSGVQDFGQLGLAGMASLSLRQGVINARTADAINGLGVMRGLAVHGDGLVSPERAEEFLALADAVIYAVDHS